MTDQTTPMPERDRRDVVLDYLVKYDIPQKHKTIYGGLIAHQEIHFSKKQTRDTVMRLYDEGLVRRVEIDANEGRIKDIPPDEPNRRAYYLISEAGRKAAPRS